MGAQRRDLGIEPGRVLHPKRARVICEGEGVRPFPSNCRKSRVSMTGKIAQMLNGALFQIDFIQGRPFGSARVGKQVPVEARKYLPDPGVQP